jgi:hypothetical protein
VRRAPLCLMLVVDAPLRSVARFYSEVSSYALRYLDSFVCADVTPVPRTRLRETAVVMRHSRSLVGVRLVFKAASVTREIGGC